MPKPVDHYVQGIIGSLGLQLAMVQAQLDQSNETLAASQAALKASEDVIAALKERYEPTSR